LIAYQISQSAAISGIFRITTMKKRVQPSILLAVYPQ